MSFINYSNIIEYVEAKIGAINTLSPTEASLVAAMANLLNGRNNPPSNMAALETYLQNRESLVDESSLAKDVTLLLGASLPSKNTVWKMREYLADGEFVVPDNIAGNVVYVTGCGGGGCGGVQQWNPASGASGSILLGGAGGFWGVKIPFAVTVAQVVAVTIGTGGAGVSINDFIASPSLNNGTSSSFGSLAFRGGSASSANGGFKPQRRITTISGGGDTTLLEPDSSGLFSSGSTQASTVSGTQFYRAIGGACGLFGNGGNGSVDTTGSANVTAQSAPANSGAGGGAALRYTGGTTPVIVTSGAGGSGRIIVEWQEFV